MYCTCTIGAAAAACADFNLVTMDTHYVCLLCWNIYLIVRHVMSHKFLLREVSLLVMSLIVFGVGFGGCVLFIICLVHLVFNIRKEFVRK